VWRGRLIVVNNHVCSFLRLVSLKVELLSREIALQIACAHCLGITKKWLISLHRSLQSYLEIHLDKDPVVPQVI
jgi:hypothetical protein